MKRSDLTERIVDIKREKGWKWKDICQKIGGYSEMLIVGALLGQMKLTKPQAAKAAELFGLSKSEEKMLNEVPMRGADVPMPPTDPLIYRFYELVMINGPAWKALIEEEFGDRMRTGSWHKRRNAAAAIGALVAAGVVTLVFNREAPENAAGAFVSEPAAPAEARDRPARKLDALPRAAPVDDSARAIVFFQD